MTLPSRHCPKWKYGLTLLVAWTMFGPMLGIVVFIESATVSMPPPPPPRPLNAIMCAVGEWQLELRGPCWMDVSKIFPPKDYTGINDTSVHTTTMIRRRPWGASLPCSLSMAEDGTFVLQPKMSVVTAKDTNAKSSADNYHDQILTLRGQWKLYKNPYCVTDRAFDELSLKSYPRTKVAMPNPNRKAVHQSGDTSAKGRMNVMEITTVDFSFYCRLWGLYDRQRLKSRRIIPSKIDCSMSSFSPYGRMTHGTVVLSRRQQHQQHNRLWNTFLNHYRPVVATFITKRCSAHPAHEGWIDQAYFGY
jgi:hypothetical protein